MGKKGRKTASERFDYWYDDKELKELVPNMNMLADKAEQVHVVFNVNRADQGQRGAAMLQKLAPGCAGEEDRVGLIRAGLMKTAPSEKILYLMTSRLLAAWNGRLQAQPR